MVFLRVWEGNFLDRWDFYGIEWGSKDGFFGVVFVIEVCRLGYLVSFILNI